MNANLSTSHESMPPKSITEQNVSPHPQYDPLPIKGRFTRLIQLLPGHHSKQLSCRLVHIDLDSPEYEYIAVSYTWGSVNSEETIIVDNFACSVRRSLYELLRAFRHPYEVQTLWCDALSIDQHSLVERNHHVQNMGEIFANAKHVKVWLGPATPDIRGVFRYINEITSLSQSRQLALQPSAIDKLSRSLRTLEHNKYWSRAWIIQELLLARDATFFAGTETFSWDQLVQTVSMVDKDTARHIRAIIVTKYFGAETWSFEELFAMFGHLECTHEADKFYSLHGLTSMNLSLGDSLPTPDYSLCINEIFLQHFRRLSEGFLSDNQMQFVRNFTSALDNPNGFCVCHARAMLDLRLKYHGEFCATVPIVASGSSGGASGQVYANTDMMIHSENDMYGSRHVEIPREASPPKSSDLAFELIHQSYYLVYRQMEKPGLPNHSGPSGRLVGVVCQSTKKCIYIGEVDAIRPLWFSEGMTPSLNRDLNFPTDLAHRNSQPPGTQDTKGLELHLTVTLESLLGLANFMNARHHLA